MSIDSIGDFLTIIRNGTLVGKPFVVAPYSKMKHAIANILQEEGFIRDIQVIEQEEVPKKVIKVVLKYVGNESVIHEITRISKPSRRTYCGAQTIKPVIGGLGLSILTTNRGLLSHKKAKELGVGGEIVCTVW
jgi:small subunit ribosomal protein S8